MDHREPPRMDSAKSAGPRRFARLMPPGSVRKLALPRFITALGTTLFAVLLAGYGLWYLGNRAVGWVNHRPEYWVPYTSVTLDPPPPRWYRGGERAFLDQVREVAPLRTDRIPILDGDSAQLREKFQKSPWVRSAQVRISPQRVVLSLDYREPVARVAGAGTLDLAIDRDGTILPVADIDREFFLSLVRLEHLKPPFDPRPGLAWHVWDEAKKCARDESRVSAAGQLASFLRSAAAGRDGGSPPPVEALLAGATDWYVQFKPAATRVRWGKPPGREGPDEPSAAEKWEMLRTWFREHPDGAEPQSYLVFSKRQVVIRRDPTASTGSL